MNKMMRLIRNIFLPLVLLSCLWQLLACGAAEAEYDATGIFEATEVVVSAEQSGKLLSLNVAEGQTVTAGTEVGVIDTVQLALKARQLGVSKQVLTAQLPDVQRQLGTLRQQLQTAREEEARFAALVKEGAANSKVLDDARSQVALLQKQIDALASTLENSTNSLRAQESVTDVQQLQIIDQLRKCHIVVPATGTVLEKYAECGELASVGLPLFKVANLDEVFLRAYVTGEQLTDIRLGQRVRVFADRGKADRKEYAGVVSWISPRAEFTPKTIQTRDERANLVYALKIRVKNDGDIKLGMYGEVRF